MVWSRLSSRMRLLALLGTTSLVLAACGEARDDEAGTTTTTTTTTTTSTTTTTTPTTTTTTIPEELPGERIEIFPFEGAELVVVGVAADDTLNLRSGPGVDFPVLFELDPLAEGITATGHNRLLDDSFWSEISVQGEIGWANTRFLLQPGQVGDITAQVWPDPADLPRAETMLELGQLVAEELASEEPPSEIVVVDGPTVTDLGEITVDVIGMADDALGGLRLWIFAEPEPGGEGFVLRTVEAMLLCLRGVTDGLCV